MATGLSHVHSPAALIGANRLFAGLELLDTLPDDPVPAEAAVSDNRFFKPL